MSYKTLSEMGTIITGKTPSTKEPSYWNGNIPFITPKDIQITKHIFDTGRCISEKGLAKQVISAYLLAQSAFPVLETLVMWE